jgi:curved DNA-binding protein CbpA
MNQQNRTHYQTLKVTKNATLDEIKSSYRNRVLETHPDRVSGREEEFRRVAEAFRILSDYTQRILYDKGLEESQEPIGKVADANRLKNYVGSANLQDKETKIYSSPMQNDERAVYRDKVRLRSHLNQNELNERLKARAAPVVKIRSGSFPVIAGSLLITAGAFYLTS